MKQLTKITITALAAFSLTACGEDTTNTGNHAEIDETPMHSTTMGDDKMMGDTGHTTGVIVSISPDGKEATIDHQDIDGVGMSAMTMGFGITSTVDLSSYAKGDSVSFMVKRGRDNSYRITAICNTANDGQDCLDTHMDHNGH
ncbi:copper-binding protein [Robiginitomaculum antarcticum]|uniref:copper-binding protein n=1 Tax=Robiginitomaculum antarcticum TaxID=437507 RepID=UPI0003733FF6|nr:copper-binding protein [Robiginitomaculum antarcticum]